MTVIGALLVLAALAPWLAVAIGASSDVRAAPQDYRFELAAPPARSADGTLVKVRLVHVPDGQAVSGAVIVQSRFDMGPEGMAGMTAPVKALPVSEAGIYSFAAQPSMAGNWGLTLSAKAPGESETVKGTITVPVAK